LWETFESIHTRLATTTTFFALEQRGSGSSGGGRPASLLGSAIGARPIATYRLRRSVCSILELPASCVAKTGRRSSQADHRHVAAGGPASSLIR